MTETGGKTESVNRTVPSSARIYDYVLGGKDHYPVDRDAAEKVVAAFPTVRVAARQNRNFMQRAVNEITAAGVTQFLDIGTGIPTEPNLHQVAQAAQPAARVVYVDNDPIVLAHARALLVGTSEGRTTYIDADLTDPAAILAAPQLCETLDLARPVALSLIAVLHFLTVEQDPYGVVATLVDALAPGSFVVASHITTALDPENMARALEVYRQSGVFAQSRSREEFARFFDGLELLEPGVVVANQWRPAGESPEWLDTQVNCWAGVARKR
ncbi:SAM-dependent methyltransferase [Nocardia zapadnayensis]|uniref:SAM-dependent methyltransferase n=1 Tax=Nocardia rhamnosiphila TaxID=426716 RepID=UPI002246755F|nr:SAM-dependent methyltransferase [Nocardia zapadnayensis]MCX0271753.1 SAM-dependent methyltransferase [Nocardia zapadnayensis]